jgi:hypothetical protein
VVIPCAAEVHVSEALAIEPEATTMSAAGRVIAMSVVVTPSPLPRSAS